MTLGLIVVKIGGATLTNAAQMGAIGQDLVALRALGHPLVLIHGGGPQVTVLLERLGIDNARRAGRRITDAATLDVVKMVLGGQLNVDLTVLFRSLGLPTIGISGASAGIVDAIKRPPRVVSGWGGEPIDFGHVGDIVGVDGGPLLALCGAGFVPLLNSIGADAEGRAYNINADIAATRIARALGAEHLVLVAGDVAGVLADSDDPSSRIATMTPSEARALIADGTIRGGMIPKIEECLVVLGDGVGAIHIAGALGPGGLIDSLSGATGTSLLPG